MARIEIANGKHANCPTNTNEMTDTIKVRNGNTRFGPFNFSNLMAEAEPKIYSAMNPAPESKNKSSNLAWMRASTISPIDAPTKMSKIARAGAALEFSCCKAKGMLLSRARAKTRRDAHSVSIQCSETGSGSQE